MVPHPPAAAPPALPVTARRARAAVFAVFVLAGVVFATWAARLPETKRALGLDPGQLGLLLLVMAAGSVVSLPLAGAVVARTGTRRATVLGAAGQTTGLAWSGIASSTWHSTPLTGLGLLVVGAGAGLWDVAMNLEGADVERRLGRAVMPSFHAGFSLGTVVAAGAGALAARRAIPVGVHLGVLAAVVLAGVVLTTRSFSPVPARPAPGASEGPGGPAGRVRARSPWTEPRTLLVGLVVLAAAFTEGTANDWVGVAAVDGYGLSPAGGALALGVFLAAMTLARLAGQRLLDRWGRVAVVRATTASAAAGALLVAFGHGVPIAAVGAVLWGAGASLGFPVGISAAADDPARAAPRVATVSTIGYVAFLAGPPLLGLLGDRVGVVRALAVVAAAAVPAFAVARVLAPRSRSGVRGPGAARSDGGARRPAPTVEA